jgi:nicotinate-nucleotide--dimethylbenzimidazole phosphoribosyltransferase
MGIGNTTPSAALIAALCGLPAAAVTGRGTGIDDAHLARKVAVVEEAVRRTTEGRDSDPIEVLSQVGGLEIAALAGFIVAGAAARVPVIVDGVISAAALLVAWSIAPGVLPYVVAGHRSTEPGASAVLEHLHLEPVALPVLQSAAWLLAEMATFDSAGVSDK